MFLKNNNWGHSSAGRALAWHARGQGFDLGSTMKKMKQARFEKVELNQILQLYGMMVSQGLWKDYSISFLKRICDILCLQEKILIGLSSASRRRQKTRSLVDFTL